MKLTVTQVREIRDNANKLSIRQLAAIYHVSKSTIGSIQRGTMYQAQIGSKCSRGHDLLDEAVGKVRSDGLVFCAICYAARRTRGPTRPEKPVDNTEAILRMCKKRETCRPWERATYDAAIANLQREHLAAVAK